MVELFFKMLEAQLALAETWGKFWFDVWSIWFSVAVSVGKVSIERSEKDVDALFRLFDDVKKHFGAFEPDGVEDLLAFLKLQSEKLKKLVDSADRA